MAIIFWIFWLICIYLGIVAFGWWFVVIICIAFFIAFRDWIPTKEERRFRKEWKEEMKRKEMGLEPEENKTFRPEANIQSLYSTSTYNGWRFSEIMNKEQDLELQLSNLIIFMDDANIAWENIDKPFRVSHIVALEKELEELKKEMRRKL